MAENETTKMPMRSLYYHAELRRCEALHREVYTSS